MKHGSADATVPAVVKHTHSSTPKPGTAARYGAGSALGLLLFAGSLSAADHWLVTESGCKVWSDGPPDAGETLSWSGACKEDRLSGAGQLMVTKGGKTVLRFEGEMRAGKASGAGKMELVSDAGTDRYEGGFKDSLLDGYGVLSLANGDRYEGGFRHDKPDGFGVYTASDGALYQGELKDGVPHGQGFETLRNGEKYRGGFQNAQFEGKGTLLFPSGDVYEGGFQNGEANGKGTLTTWEGEVYSGSWRDGKAEGEFTVTKADGSTETQLWKNDKRVR